LFAVATSVRPKILIVDEMLGAGDAVFLLQIDGEDEATGGSRAAPPSCWCRTRSATSFNICDETIWIERGRIMKRGHSMKWVNAYEGFIRTLDERRIRGKNNKLRSKTVPSFLLDQYGDTISFISLSWDQPEPAPTSQTCSC